MKFAKDDVQKRLCEAQKCIIIIIMVAYIYENLWLSLLLFGNVIY